MLNGKSNRSIMSDFDAVYEQDSVGGNDQIDQENFGKSNKDDIKKQRRKKKVRDLKESKSYRLISTITKFGDRYFLDAIVGFIPSVGDLISSAFGLPFLYVTIVKVKSVPLTLAVIYNYLIDILLGCIPFFIGDVIDFFCKAHTKNLDLITQYVEGDKKTVREVRSKALLTFILIILLCVIIYFTFRLLLGVTEWTWSLFITLFKVHRLNE